MIQPPDTTGFSVCQVATTGCEVRDPEGIVIAWTATRAWAMIFAGLLEMASENGLSLPQAMPSEGIHDRD